MVDAPQPVDPAIGGGDRVDPSGHQPVDPPEHGILLVDQGRDLVLVGGEQGRQRRISAKADHCRGLERLVEARRHRPAGQDVADRLEPARRAAAEPPRRQDMDLDAVEQPGDTGAAIVGDQSDAMPAPHQLFGQGMGRDHMAAGAAGGENIMAGQRHRPLHFTT